MPNNICEKLISSCVGADCNNPIFSGIEGKAWIFNKSQVEGFTYDQTNPNLITAITMATYEDGGQDVSYVGYTIDQLGRTPFTGTTTSMTEGNIANKFTETFVFVVPDNSPTAAMLLDNVANGKFVVVVENEYNGTDGKGKFQVYGGKKGLVCTAMERDAYSEENDGAWAVTLTAEGAPNSALFIEHKTGTDVDTKSYLDSLVDCD